MNQSGPSIHYRQHHDVEAPRVDDVEFRQAWRVRTRLDGLLFAQAITPREWFAASSYRRDWYAAFGHGLKSSAVVVQGPIRVSGDKYTIRRLDALAALRAVSRGIGPGACRLIEACVIDDMSWRELGLRLDVHHRTARTWTILAIKMLTSVIHFV